MGGAGDEVDQTITSLRVVTSAIAISLLTFAGVAAAFRDAIARPAAGAAAGWLPAGVALAALAAAAGYAALRRQARADLQRRALRSAPAPIRSRPCWGPIVGSRSCARR